MQNSIISEGKTTNEAIENGLKKLGVTKKDVEIKVLEEEKKSFFDILAPRIVKVELILKEGKNAQCKRNKQANNKPACGQGACGGENTVDNVVKHSEKSFRLWMKTLGTERYRIVQPQYAAPRF